jgi:hypothetical protein
LIISDKLIHLEQCLGNLFPFLWNSPDESFSNSIPKNEEIFYELISSSSKSGRMRIWIWWCTPIILAMWEAEMRGPRFKASPGKKISKILSKKQTRHGGT